MAKKHTLPILNKTGNSLISAQLTWLPKKTFELAITIPKDEVEKTYEHVLDHAVEHAELKGFRKGKAPKRLVEESIGKSKLYEEVVNKIVSKAYYDSVKQHNLQPITQPQITPVSMEEGKDWVVKAISAETPEVKLGKYKEAIKGLKAKNAIWTPDKATEDKDKQPEIKLEQIFDELLKEAMVELPDMIVEKETNRLMANLLDQVNALGMTIQNYLNSKQATQEQLRNDYRRQAESTLKLDFIINKVAEEEKIQVSEAEIQQIVEKTQDTKAKEQMKKPEEKLYLAILLRRQKAVDFLKGL